MNEAEPPTIDDDVSDMVGMLVFDVSNRTAVMSSHCDLQTSQEFLATVGIKGALYAATTTSAPPDPRAVPAYAVKLVLFDGVAQFAHVHACFVTKHDDDTVSVHTDMPPGCGSIWIPDVQLPAHDPDCQMTTAIIVPVVAGTSDLTRLVSGLYISTVTDTPSHAYRAISTCIMAVPFMYSTTTDSVIHLSYNTSDV